MASPFVTKRTERLQHPTIPEFWVDVSVPLSGGDLDGMETNGSQIAMSFGLMARVITAWADERPVCVESVKDLDLDTTLWLSSEVMKHSGVKDAEEKKDSASASSQRSSTGANSRRSSRT